MNLFKISIQTVAALLIGSVPAYALDPCSGNEPICDYPEVPVCVPHQLQGGYSQPVWICQSKANRPAPTLNNYPKQQPKKEQRPNAGFFTDGFSQDPRGDFDGKRPAAEGNVNKPW